VKDHHPRARKGKEKEGRRVLQSFFGGVRCVLEKRRGRSASEGKKGGDLLIF